MVEDNIPPVLANCPAAVFAETEGLLTYVQWTEPTATDNGVDVPLASAPNYNAAYFYVGRTGPFVYKFTDDAGNTAECEIYIVVSGMFRKYFVDILII